MPQSKITPPPNDAPQKEYLVTVRAFHCNRCGHFWLARDHNVDAPPRSCAHCKSPYWRSKRQMVEVDNA